MFIFSFCFTTPHIIMYSNVTMDQGVITRGNAQRQLILAGYRGDHGEVMFLVGQGVNPNAQSGIGTTPSMAAAEEGREDLAQFLLGLPAINLEARCEEGWTALLVASSKGHLIMVK